MKKIISLLMCLVLCVVPMSAMAEVGSSASLEAILEIEPENMTYDQYFMFEHGFHSDEESANATLLSRKTKDGDSLLTQNAGAVYADGRRVSGYVGNSEMVFYMVGNSIYRYHVKSQRTDLIYQGNGIVTWYPITSKVLLIGKNSNGLSTMALAGNEPSCTDSLNMNQLTYYRIDVDTKETKIASDPEHLIFLTRGSGYTNLSSYSSMINGTTIPFSNYPIGSAFTSSYGGSTQCAGFSLLVYANIWGSTGYGSGGYYYSSGSSATSMKNVLSTKNVGARVRVSDTYGSQNNGHSFIICARNSSNITVYHSNWENDNVVYVTRFTYSQLNSYYPYVHFVQNP